MFVSANRPRLSAAPASELSTTPSDTQDLSFLCDDGFDKNPARAPAWAGPARSSPSEARKADLVDRALAQLAELAADPERFHATMAKAFGPGYDRAAAEDIRRKILSGDRSWLPAVELADAGQLGGAKGAYRSETATVYVDADIRSPKRAAEVLLEEIGHHLDARLNKSDSAGDEGEIFRRLVVGETLDDAALAGLRAENDHGKMLLDGQLVDVENWNLSWVYDWLISKPVVRDFVRETADRIVNYLATFDTRIRAAAKEWADHLVANAKALGKDLLQSMEQVVQGFGKLATGDLSGLTDILAGLANQQLAGFHAFARLTIDTVSAVQVTLGIEPIGRQLTGDEITRLRRIFGDSIDYSKVLVKEGDAGIFAGGRALTMGNTIYMKDIRDPDTLAHEMAHVWQFQNGGNDYMLKAGWAQFSNFVAGNPTHDAYDWTRDIHKGWAALNPEQQAQLIEDGSRSGYVNQLEAWKALSSQLEAKEAAYRRKYPTLTLLGPRKTPGNLNEVHSMPRRSPAVEAQRLAERAALDAERALLLANRPKFEFGGVDRTAELDDALSRVRNRVGAP